MACKQKKEKGKNINEEGIRLFKITEEDYRVINNFFKKIVKKNNGTKKLKTKGITIICP